MGDRFATIDIHRKLRVVPFWGRGARSSSSTMSHGRAGLPPYRVQPPPHTHTHNAGAQQPDFWAHICCGQRAAWVKMPLGNDVDLGSGYIVSDGDPLSKWGTAPPPIFGPCLLRSNVGWMDQDSTWFGTDYEGRARPRPHCFRLGPSSSPRKGAEQPPCFRRMFILAKPSPISATAEHLCQRVQVLSSS